jgi:hypothetical protein
MDNSTTPLTKQPQFSPYLFWDSNPERIDYERDKNKVIRRVFDRGRLDDLGELMWFYPEETIVRSLLTAGYLPENAIYLAMAMFNLKREDFKYYTSKQYHPLF